MTMPQMERRIFTMELRVQRRASDSDPDRLVGHGAVFDQLSVDLGGFREEIAPGTFSESIQIDDIRSLFNHDPSMLIGRNRAGTLKLREDERGLAYEVDLPDTQYARDLIVSVERGDVTGNSFSFETISDEWRTVEGEEIRRLVKARLFDVGPVTFPAYPQTDLALRSLEAWREQRSGTPKLSAWRRRMALLDSESPAGVA